MTIDLRAPNYATIKDDRPMPHIEALLAELGGSRFLAKLDLLHGFWQLRVGHGASAHSFRGAGSDDLFEPVRALQGFKKTAIHLQVHAAERFALYKNSY